ncbi:hypothetical protein GMRT_14046 [Giardia muris]|uniref:Uncharacterized protein n=1 Tax=Giardia muris TaxID=5742 RepID=A0A4Z1SQI9_GIAMU|nr:hypothetical protein GMRT_14046 [Giardia muris]|eukprot:TNJ27195.1 hypothetical protein GMRT_14046 [Giardia muris]
MSFPELESTSQTVAQRLFQISRVCDLIVTICLAMALPTQVWRVRLLVGLMSVIYVAALTLVHQVLTVYRYRNACLAREQRTACSRPQFLTACRCYACEHYMRLLTLSPIIELVSGIVFRLVVYPRLPFQLFDFLAPYRLTSTVSGVFRMSVIPMRGRWLGAYLLVLSLISFTYWTNDLPILQVIFRYSFLMSVSGLMIRRIVVSVDSYTEQAEQALFSNNIARLGVHVFQHAVQPELLVMHLRRRLHYSVNGELDFIRLRSFNRRFQIVAPQTDSLKAVTAHVVSLSDIVTDSQLNSPTAFSKIANNECNASFTVPGAREGLHNPQSSIPEPKEYVFQEENLISETIIPLAPREAREPKSTLGAAVPPISLASGSLRSGTSSGEPDPLSLNTCCSCPNTAINTDKQSDESGAPGAPCLPCRHKDHSPRHRCRRRGSDHGAMFSLLDDEVGTPRYLPGMRSMASLGCLLVDYSPPPVYRLAAIPQGVQQHSSDTKLGRNPLVTFQSKYNVQERYVLMCLFRLERPLATFQVREHSSVGIDELDYLARANLVFSLLDHIILKFFPRTTYIYKLRNDSHNYYLYVDISAKLTDRFRNYNACYPSYTRDGLRDCVMDCKRECFHVLATFAVLAGTLTSVFGLEYTCFLAYTISVFGSFNTAWLHQDAYCPALALFDDLIYGVYELYRRGRTCPRGASVSGSASIVRLALQLSGKIIFFNQIAGYTASFTTEDFFTTCPRDPFLHEWIDPFAVDNMERAYNLPRTDYYALFLTLPPSYHLVPLDLVVEHAPHPTAYPIDESVQTEGMRLFEVVTVPDVVPALFVLLRYSLSYILRCTHPSPVDEVLDLERYASLMSLDLRLCKDELLRTLSAVPFFETMSSVLNLENVSIDLVFHQSLTPADKMYLLLTQALQPEGFDPHISPLATQKPLSRALRRQLMAQLHCNPDIHPLETRENARSDEQVQPYDNQALYSASASDSTCHVPVLPLQGLPYSNYSRNLPPPTPRTAGALSTGLLSRFQLPHVLFPRSAHNQPSTETTEITEVRNESPHSPSPRPVVVCRSWNAPLCGDMRLIETFCQRLGNYRFETQTNPLFYDHMRSDSLDFQCRQFERPAPEAVKEASRRFRQFSETDNTYDTVLYAYYEACQATQAGVSLLLESPNDSFASRPFAFSFLMDSMHKSVIHCEGGDATHTASSIACEASGNSFNLLLARAASRKSRPLADDSVDTGQQTILHMWTSCSSHSGPYSWSLAPDTQGEDPSINAFVNPRRKGVLSSTPYSGLPNVDFTSQGKPPDSVVATAAMNVKHHDKLPSADSSLSVLYSCTSCSQPFSTSLTTDRPVSGRALEQWDLTIPTAKMSHITRSTSLTNRELFRLHPEDAIGMLKKASHSVVFSNLRKDISNIPEGNDGEISPFPHIDFVPDFDFASLLSIPRSAIVDSDDDDSDELTDDSIIPVCDHASHDTLEAKAESEGVMNIACDYRRYQSPVASMKRLVSRPASRSQRDSEVHQCSDDPVPSRSLRTCQTCSSILVPLSLGDERYSQTWAYTDRSYSPPTYSMEDITLTKTEYSMMSLTISNLSSRSSLTISCMNTPCQNDLEADSSARTPDQSMCTQQHFIDLRAERPHIKKSVESSFYTSQEFSLSCNPQAAESTHRQLYVSPRFHAKDVHASKLSPFGFPPLARMAQNHDSSKPISYKGSSAAFFRQDEAGPSTSTSQFSGAIVSNEKARSFYPPSAVASQSLIDQGSLQDGIGKMEILPASQSGGQLSGLSHCWSERDVFRHTRRIGAMPKERFHRVAFEKIPASYDENDDHQEQVDDYPLTDSSFSKKSMFSSTSDSSTPTFEHSRGHARTREPRSNRAIFMCPNDSHSTLSEEQSGDTEPSQQVDDVQPFPRVQSQVQLPSSWFERFISCLRNLTTFNTTLAMFEGDQAGTVDEVEPRCEVGVADEFVRKESLSASSIFSTQMATKWTSGLRSLFMISFNFLQQGTKYPVLLSLSFEAPKSLAGGLIFALPMLISPFLFEYFNKEVHSSLLELSKELRVAPYDPFSSFIVSFHTGTVTWRRIFAFCTGISTGPHVSFHTYHSIVLPLVLLSVLYQHHLSHFLRPNLWRFNLLIMVFYTLLQILVIYFYELATNSAILYFARASTLYALLPYELRAPYWDSFLIASHTFIYTIFIWLLCLAPQLVGPTFLSSHIIAIIFVTLPMKLVLAYYTKAALLYLLLLAIIVLCYCLPLTRAHFMMFQAQLSTHDTNAQIRTLLDKLVTDLTYEHMRKSINIRYLFSLNCYNAPSGQEEKGSLQGSTTDHFFDSQAVPLSQGPLPPSSTAARDFIRAYLSYHDHRLIGFRRYVQSLDDALVLTITIRNLFGSPRGQELYQEEKPSLLQESLAPFDLQTNDAFYSSCVELQLIPFIFRELRSLERLIGSHMLISSVHGHRIQLIFHPAMIADAARTRTMRTILGFGADGGFSLYAHPFLGTARYPPSASLAQARVALALYDALACCAYFLSTVCRTIQRECPRVSVAMGIASGFCFETILGDLRINRCAHGVAVERSNNIANWAANWCIGMSHAATRLFDTLRDSVIDFLDRDTGNIKILKTVFATDVFQFWSPSVCSQKLEAYGSSLCVTRDNCGVRE